MDTQEQVQGTEVDTEQQQVADQFAEADEKGAVDEPQAPSIEELASEMGWVPKEKFKGDETDWKPAHEFIRVGKDIQRSTSRELKELRGTMDTVIKTNASVLQQTLAKERSELAAQYAAAVEKGDPDKAWEAAQGIQKIDSQRIETRAPSPEALEWGQKNSKVMADPLAAQRAVQLCEPYAKQGWGAGQQLQAIEPILRREFPHLFDAAETKAPPGVAQPTRVNGSRPKGETYADLPREAKAIADDMVERGVIKGETPQAAKEMYARNYFANARKDK